VENLRALVLMLGGGCWGSLYGTWVQGKWWIFLMGWMLGALLIVLARGIHDLAIEEEGKDF
jgi:hypothetical protein